MRRGLLCAVLAALFLMPSVNIQAIVHELRRVLKPAAFQDLTLDDFTEATTPTGKPKINLSESGHVGIFGFAGASGSGGVAPVEAGPSSAFLNSFAQLGTLGIGTDSSFAGAALWETVDGFDWNGFDLPIQPSTAPKSIVWAQEIGKIVVIGTGRAASSPDGAVWTNTLINVGFTGQAIGWNGSLLVAVGNLGQIYTSPDAVTWTAQVSGTTANLFGIAWSPTLSLWCAVGQISGGVTTILTSPDGVTWTVQTFSALNISLADVVFAQIVPLPVFVAGANTGDIITSADGVNWSAVSPQVTANPILAVTASGTLIAALTNAGEVITSDNAQIWTLQAITGLTGANVILWSGTAFIAAGNKLYASSSTGSGAWSVSTGQPIANISGLAAGPLISSPAITGFKQIQSAADVAVPAGVNTTVLTTTITIPSGQPQRIRTDWLINVGMGATGALVNAWISDGTNLWGGASNRIEATLNSGLNASGVSQVRYNPGTVVTITLIIASGQACTAQHNSPGGGPITQLNVSTETAN